MTENGLQAPPASVRNAGPILEVLTRVLSPPAFTGTDVLEIAAGSGYHAPIFAKALPHIGWQPSDPNPEALTSITAHVTSAALPNLYRPVTLDTTSPTWPVTTSAAVVCINMIHISPWAATLGLFAGAARLGARVIVTYGPYSIAGDFLAESNVAFDQSLRARNSTWGIRDVNAVADAAKERGFTLDETIRMPANNLTLIFRKA